MNDAVRHYYDRNTASFERFGQGAATVHRAVWGEGVTSREEAFAYLDGLVAAEITASEPPSIPRVLDLGCGVGASLLRLARRIPALEAVGVTISSVQAVRAAQLISEAGLSDRVSALEADFLRLPTSIGGFDVAFAIESFVHCSDAAAFFAAVCPHLRPGARLMICDDFLQRAPASARETRWVDSIKEGWLASQLASVETTLAHAGRAGLSLLRDTNLTPHLELRRFRDRVMTILLWLGSPFRIQGPRWGSWVGGDALQSALLGGLVEYHCIVLERR